MIERWFCETAVMWFENWTRSDKQIFLWINAIKSPIENRPSHWKAPALMFWFWFSNQIAISLIYCKCCRQLLDNQCCVTLTEVFTRANRLKVLELENCTDSIHLMLHAFTSTLTLTSGFVPSAVNPCEIHPCEAISINRVENNTSQVMTHDEGSAYSGS